MKYNLASYLAAAAAVFSIAQSNDAGAWTRVTSGTSCTRSTLQDGSGQWTCPYVSDGGTISVTSYAYVQITKSSSAPKFIGAAICRQSWSGGAAVCGGPSQAYLGAQWYEFDISNQVVAMRGAGDPYYDSWHFRVTFPAGSTYGTDIAVLATTTSD